MRRLSQLALSVSLALPASLLAAYPAPAAAPGPASNAPSQSPSNQPPQRILDPDKVLGRGWNSSDDRAVTLATDTDGAHLLVADSRDAYQWRTVTTLAEPGMPADSWIGNECVMDRSHAAVVYAPRTFTNHEELMERGAFTAVVNLDSGKVTKLPFTGSLAYFDPSCNPTSNTAAFTAIGDDKTRVITVDTSGKVLSKPVAQGEITSAVPTRDGVVAASGPRLVHVTSTGAVKTIAATDSTPYQLRVNSGGDVTFLDHKGDTEHAKHLAQGHTNTLAAGKLGSLGLQQGTSGTFFLTGHPQQTALPKTDVKALNVSTDAVISTRGALAVDPVLAPGMRSGLERIADAAHPKPQLSQPQRPQASEPDGPGLMTVTATATATGKRVTESAATQSSTVDGTGQAASPALAQSGAKRAMEPRDAGVSHSTVDADRWCSVPRNDVNSQALQPTPNQVEWAVGMAVRGDLRSNWIAQGGWRSQIGISTIDPQSLFPLPALNGGGRIPAQVLLGIMAQESNLWQAEPGVIPGQMGNPLASTDGFYGHKAADGDPMSYWQIHWDKSDCGYGVGQVTDGMRLPGRAKSGETPLAPEVQRAVALDYTVNVAASAQILAQKWNEIHQPGQTIAINNDSASSIENWFAAVWNYNLGFNAPTPHSNDPWGLGWYNNPANPIYPPGRDPFMDTSIDPLANHDAAHPQDWPYEEKVMGWAAWSIDTGFSFATDGQQDAKGAPGYNTAGFNPAWWAGSSPQIAGANRSDVKPPLATFCNANNACDVSNPPPCETQHIDGCDILHWWHDSATWKPACTETCGHENLKYGTLRQEPGRGFGGPYGTPVCTTSGLPSGSMIITSVPDGTPVYSPGCNPTWTDSGSFQFTFSPDSQGYYEARGDLHQIGGGLGAHFWYAKTRSDSTGVYDNSKSDKWYGTKDAPFLPTADGVQAFTSTPVDVTGQMAIRGDWTLNQRLNGWVKVFVHTPDTGITAQQAIYTINTGSGTTNRVINAHNRANTWVSLGAVYFSGTGPQGITLTNYAVGATADNTIAWGAVAFQPLPGKPKDTVVQLGDSYSAGTGVGDYYTNADTGPHLKSGDPKPADFDACLRSKRSWIRQTTLPGTTASLGDRDNTNDPTLDLHAVACSGATTDDASVTGQYGEIPQIYSGFLNQDTTLVAMTIGGDDAGFAKTLTTCVVTGCPADSTVSDELQKAAKNVESFLAVVHSVAPSAKIVVLGYPEMFDDSVADCVDIGLHAQTHVISKWAKELNSDLQTYTAQADTGGKAAFYNPNKQFSNHLLCDSSPGLHSLTTAPSDDIASDPQFSPSSPASMESYHPTDMGAGLYAQALQDALNNASH